MPNNSLEQRALEVRSHLRTLELVENGFYRVRIDHSRAQVSLWRHWAVISKATTFLLLYNNVEATVREELSSFYAAVEANNCTAAQVTRNLLEMWVEQGFRSAQQTSATLDTFRSTGSVLINQVVENQTIKLDSKKIRLTGNLDDRQIRRLCQRHDIAFPSRGVSRDGTMLQTIKDKRNDLAHGACTFEEVGRDYSLSQLTDFAAKTEVFLKSFRTSVRHAARHRKFRRT